MSNFYAVLGDMKKDRKRGQDKNGARPQFNLKKWGLAPIYTGPFFIYFIS